MTYNYNGKDMNYWANQWRDIGGPNVLPMNDKVPNVGGYKNLLDKPIDSILHNHWIKNNFFENGIGIVNGRCHHNKYKNKMGLWIHTIDVDTETGKKLILDLFEVQSLEELSKKGVVVEQHKGNPVKFHVIIFTKGELPNLASNPSGVEIKGSCKLTTVTPTVYEDGSYREFVGDSLNSLGSPVPISHTKFMYTLHEKLLPLGVNYLCRKVSANINYNPVSRNKQKIPNGQRHDTLIRYANSLIGRLHKTTNRETIQKYFETYNQEECEEPLGSQGPGQREELKELKKIFDDAWDNIGKSNTNSNQQQEQQQKEQENGTERVLSVLEAKRIHSGRITVIGTIVSVSEMYILPQNDLVNDVTVSIDRNAKSIQLEDTENLDENERLDVILFDEMINKVIAGEVIEVTGDMRVVGKKCNSKSKKKINVLHATSIKYVNRKEFVITKKDIADFDKFVSYPDPLKRLTAMFAPNIIGHDDAKRGLLRSIVAGVNRGKKGGGRVDSLMVGDMGTAKSKLGAEATEIKPNSRHVSAPHATTKTITAIPERINDSVVIVYGAIPLSRGAICAIDEITSFPIEDQARLLSVLEEGKINLDKLGVRSVIDSPTTIIATANPVQTKWNNPQTISNEEIDLKRNLLDRFPQIYGFRDEMDDDQTQKFVSEMDKIDRRRQHNYNFLRKYLIYASSIKDVKFTKGARYMLNQFWAKGKVKGLLTTRMYYGIYKIAEAHAKLQLRDVVDEHIAEHVLDEVRLMMIQYGETVEKILDPREIAYNACLEVLRKSESGITIEAMCKQAIKQNQQTAFFLGYIWNMENNHKLRQVVDSLLNHPSVKKINSKPIVLRYLSDTSDTSDIKIEYNGSKR